MNWEDRLYRAAPGPIRTALLNLHALRIRHHRYGHRYEEVTREWDGLAWASSNELQAYQSERLAAVVEAAANTVFYRKLWSSAGVTASSIRSVADLSRLPIVTKEALRDAGEAATTELAPRAGWLHGHTSGTTGSPLSLWYDREMCILNNSAERLQKVWAGVEAHDWIGLLLGRVITPLSESSPPFWHANYVHKQVWFSSFHLRDETVAFYVAEMRRRGLRFVEGYPSTLFILAQWLLKHNQTLPLKAVFSSSETLHQVQREAITQAFAAPIFDYFGHAERAVFAIECDRHEGKHIIEPYGVVEIVDAKGRVLPDGEEGYIVGTSLHNRAMPMIRYRTSDISAIETGECACGRKFRRIRSISTKAEDIVVLPDGRWISPSILTHPFKPYPAIVKSQIIQESLDRLRVLLVTRPEFSAEMEAGLIAEMSARVGLGVSIVVERVEDIPREKSGKYRWVISKIDHALRMDWRG